MLNNLLVQEENAHFSKYVNPVKFFTEAQPVEMHKVCPIKIIFVFVIFLVVQ